MKTSLLAPRYLLVVTLLWSPTLLFVAMGQGDQCVVKISDLEKCLNDNSLEPGFLYGCKQCHIPKSIAENDDNCEELQKQACESYQSCGDKYNCAGPNGACQSIWDEVSNECPYNVTVGSCPIEPCGATSSDNGGSGSGSSNGNNNSSSSRFAFVVGLFLIASSWTFLWVYCFDFRADHYLSVYSFVCKN